MLSHVVKTARNAVHVEPRLPDDIFCYVFWQGKEQMQRFPLRYIDEYQASVDWALGMADYLVSPVYVLTVNYNDIIRTKRVEQFIQLAERLTSRDDRETWLNALSICIDAAWRNPDEGIRQRAGAVLLGTGVQVPPNLEEEMLWPRATPTPLVSSI